MKVPRAREANLRLPETARGREEETEPFRNRGTRHQTPITEELPGREAQQALPETEEERERLLRERAVLPDPAGKIPRPPVLSLNFLLLPCRGKPGPGQ